MRDVASAADAALPPEVAVGNAARWFAYRHFPVFSRPWLRRRALLFVVLVGALAVLGALVSGSLAGASLSGIAAAAAVFARFMLIGFAGPLLAAWLRSRTWPEAPSAGAMIAVLLAGMLAAAAISQFALKPIERALRPPSPLTHVRTASPLPTGAGQRPLEIPALRPDAGSALVVTGQWRPSPLLAALSTLADVLLYLLIGGGLAFLAWVGEQRRLADYRHHQTLARLRQDKQQADLRLGVLQSQVEPHFLFNTLAALRSVLRSDPGRAEAMLDAFVDYLRATIPKLRADAERIESTLGDQVELCRRYLELMQLRMGDRLRFRIEVPEALARLPFPPLLLISLVENAIKHGIEPKPGPGQVQIVAQRVVDQIDVRVVDDGVGLQPGLGSGLGLANIRDQLATRYGARAALDLRSGEHGGTVASLRLPLTEPPA